VGLVGAVIGGYLASLLDIQGTFHFWGSVIIAFIGACILVAVLQLLSGRRRRTP
ncbi:MAG TPA: GlsB/YeaQ/YmgE family stress response membrane protein, partial [Ktedonobacteraceae bacterium]|nr:GlsB/YeaQ/YmgE family stress response membrane protein [Ktedonobacteraceae bacterium]